MPAIVVPPLSPLSLSPPLPFVPIRSSSSSLQKLAGFPPKNQTNMAHQVEIKLGAPPPHLQ